MTYLLNISFALMPKTESNFVIWAKNTPFLEPFDLYRVIGSTENGLTYSAQIRLETILDVQKLTSEIHQFLQVELKKDFNEEITYFMSALEYLK